MALHILVALSALSLISIASADVIVTGLPQRVPQVLFVNQLKNQDFDTMQRSNIVNQFNQRSGDEEYVDQLPCRSNIPMTTKVNIQRGAKVAYGLRFNNPHDGNCEVSLWKNGQVYPAMLPRPCGGGFKRSDLDFYMPANAPECLLTDTCFLQFYFHSAEPRDYASCTDVIIEGKAPTAAVIKRELGKRQFQPPALPQGPVPAMIYRDGQDAKLANKDFNQYRGQYGPTQQADCRWQLKKCTGVGHAQTLEGQTAAKIAFFQSIVSGAITIAENAQNAKLKQSDSLGKAQLDEQKAQMIRNFNQKDQAMYYPADKYFTGAKAYGLSDLNDDNADRQTTATYQAGMDFCSILKTHQNDVDTLCNYRNNAGNLNAYSTGGRAQAIQVPSTNAPGTNVTTPNVATDNVVTANDANPYDAAASAAANVAPSNASDNVANINKAVSINSRV